MGCEYPSQPISIPAYGRGRIGITSFFTTYLCASNEPHSLRDTLRWGSPQDLKSAFINVNQQPLALTIYDLLLTIALRPPCPIGMWQNKERRITKIFWDFN